MPAPHPISKELLTQKAWSQKTKELKSILFLQELHVYYKKERKWKQQVINDWKSDKLRYKHSEATLSTVAFKLGGSPIDESAFF